MSGQSIIASSGSDSLSSKLSNLKQEAYQAAKRRNWVEAISIYERLLDLDKNNPALLNELGDICLKNQDPPKAVRQFLNAAAKYKQNGLLNNAVAVYKKVLRHEPDNINAHWFLAEIRSSQGLVMEGEVHAERFLAAADVVAGEIKEIFLKRCVQLLALYPGSRAILERMQGVFRVWNLPLEEARTACLLAVVLRGEGEAKAGAALVQRALEFCPEVANYIEYTRWQTASGTTTNPANFADVNTVELGAADEPVAAPEPVVPEVPVRPEPTTMSWDIGAELELEPEPVPPPATPSALPVDAFEQFLAGTSDTDDAVTTNAPGQDAVGAFGRDSDDGLPRDDDGCFAIDTDDTGTETSFADLIDAATASIGTPAKSADPLQKILDDVGPDSGGDAGQVDTITSEIGQHVGGEGEQDAEALYQQGLVYLELGLHAQAAESFAAASGSAQYALRACEMLGVSLERDGRDREALTAFEQGLAVTGVEPRSILGLHYHAAQLHERLGNAVRARAHYEEIHAIDPTFLDVAQRIQQLVP